MSIEELLAEVRALEPDGRPERLSDGRWYAAWGVAGADPSSAEIQARIRCTLSNLHWLEVVSIELGPVERFWYVRLRVNEPMPIEAPSLGLEQ
jgi:hypothetical protein